MDNLEKITLLNMIKLPIYYSGLPADLIQLPLPDNMMIAGKRFAIPQDIDSFTSSINYGQRLYLSHPEPNDFALIIRMIAGYYYSFYTKKSWDEDNVSLFSKIVVTCKAIEIYPTAMHLLNLMGELADREKTLLHREPSQMERAAGIERLNSFTELNNLDFLRDAMKCTVPEVLLTPYNECLVRFINAKEVFDYQTRYFEIQKADNEAKNKNR